MVYEFKAGIMVLVVGNRAAMELGLEKSLLSGSNRERTASQLLMHMPESQLAPRCGHGHHDHDHDHVSVSVRRRSHENDNEIAYVVGHGHGVFVLSNRTRWRDFALSALASVYVSVYPPPCHFYHLAVSM